MSQRIARTGTLVPAPEGTVAAELIAVLVAVTDGDPRVLTVEGGAALPSGPFESGHRSLQAGLRAWVEQQTHHPLGYVEQLYTFADRGRSAQDPALRAISISYLGLTREARAVRRIRRRMAELVSLFSVGGPARGRHASAGDDLLGACTPGPTPRRMPRCATTGRARIAINFGLEPQPWNEELVLQRYETLWEAGLVPEVGRHGGLRARRWRTTIAASWPPASRGCAARSNTARWCSS